MGNLYRQKNAHQPANIPAQIQSGPSMDILGTPLGITHAPANPQGPINLLGREDIPVQIQSGPSMGILGTPLRIKHAPANPPGPINLPGPEDIPVQIQADPPMGILGRPMGMRHAPLVDIPEAAALNVEDPFIHPLMWRGGCIAQCQICAKLASSFGNNPDVFFLNLVT